MRIAIGSLQCESNSLTPVLTRKSDFDIAYGQDMLQKLEISDICKENHIEVIPTLYAHALPGGPVEKNDFLALAQGIVEKIPVNGIDGVWLFLHGAMYVDGISSGDTYLLKMLREKIGYNIPVSVAMDFHANNTDEIPLLCNCVCAFCTAPHRDQKATQIRAMKALITCITEKILPSPQLSRANVMIPGDAVQTALSPLKEIMETARQMEQTIPGMLSVQVFNGQQWVDVPYVGPSFLVTHKNNSRIASQCANKLAEMFYQARYRFKFLVETASPSEAIQKAMSATESQVFLSDSGDNTTAGAAGDNAFLLNKLKSAGARNVLLAGIVDQEACRKCYAVPLNSTLTLKVGGSLDSQSESTVISGKLIHRGDILSYQHDNGGPSATLDCGDMTVVITENRAAMCRPDIFQSIQLDFTRFKIVVVKLGYLFPELSAVAPRSILVFTPGTSTELPENMHLKNVRRPMYPLDDNFQ